MLWSIWGLRFKLHYFVVRHIQRCFGIIPPSISLPILPFIIQVTGVACKQRMLTLLEHLVLLSIGSSLGFLLDPYFHLCCSVVIYFVCLGSWFPDFGLGFDYLGVVRIYPSIFVWSTFKTLYHRLLLVRIQRQVFHICFGRSLWQDFNAWQSVL